MTAFTELRTCQPLRNVYIAKPEKLTVVLVTQWMNVDKIVMELCYLHREVATERLEEIESDLQRQIRRTIISPFTLEIGDFVLVEDREMAGNAKTARPMELFSWCNMLLISART